ncbi:MAG: glycosyltransferase family 4 protein [Prevotella sp.]|nr:glycosyltransferase family 4 protein [Prevotella sp.]
MKVLIVSTNDVTGGAAIAASRLTEALGNNGVSVRMLVCRKLSNGLYVGKVGNKWSLKWNFLYERLVIWLHNSFSRKNLFKVSIANTGFDITRSEEFKNADVVHLHWVNQGMLSLKVIGKILKSGKPVVCTMHDMWAATAICHHARECEQFHSECRDCPQIKGGRFAAKVWRKKQQILSDCKVTFVCCSEWLASESRKSALLKGQTIISIPNPIDTRLFRPKDKAEARRMMGLPVEGRVVLLASVRVTDVRKGADYFVEAVRMLAHNNPELQTNTTIAILGGQAEEMAVQMALPACPLGYISDASRIVCAYSAADVFVLPSLEENLPNTLMEAMACGVPCVGFNVGGIPEMIEHRVTGYVAQYKDAADLAEGMRFVLCDADNKQLSEACLKKVANRWSEQSVARRYTELYESISFSHSSHRSASTPDMTGA